MSNKDFALYLDSELADDASSVLNEILANRGINKDSIQEVVAEREEKRFCLPQPGIVATTLPKMWGNYILDYKKADSAFYKSIHISYPDEQDRKKAKEKDVNPGGTIMIHGQKNGLGWL